MVAPRISIHRARPPSVSIVPNMALTRTFLTVLVAACAVSAAADLFPAGLTAAADHSAACAMIPEEARFYTSRAINTPHPRTP